MREGILPRVAVCRYTLSELFSEQFASILDYEQWNNPRSGS